MTLLTPEQIVERLRGACGDAITEARCEAWAEGTQGHRSRSVWIRIRRDRFKTALRALADIHYPHLGVISGCDMGEVVELLYHLYIYYGEPYQEILVTLAVPLPKDDLTIPTITDLIPGALISEREKQEMLGVRVIDIPDSRRIFLPDDFPEGVYPWRKDETGVPESMIKQLWQAGRGDELLAEPEDAAATRPEPAAAQVVEIKPLGGAADEGEGGQPA